MSWGFLAGAAAKTALGAAVRGSEHRPGRGAVQAPTSPRPVSFVVPTWLGVMAGGFLATGALVVVAFFLRTTNGRSTPGEALVSALLGMVICGLPGVTLAVLGARGHRERRRHQIVQALVARSGAVPLAELAAALGVGEAEARATALAALREGHVLGHVEEASGLLVAVGPTHASARAVAAGPGDGARPPAQPPGGT